MDGCFDPERTVAKNGAMTGLRTLLPIADAEQLASARRPIFEVCRGTAARSPGSGHRTPLN